jgi:hypothetical protein
MKFKLAKRAIALALSFTLVMAVFAPVVASAGAGEMRFEIGRTAFTIDGQQRTLEYAPFIANGVHMIPIRAIAEAMDATVNFNAAARTVTINRGADVVNIAVDSPLPGGMGTPVIRGDRTFVPAQFAADALGVQVSINAGVVIVTLPNGAPTPPAAAETPETVVPEPVVPEPDETEAPETPVADETETPAAAETEAPPMDTETDGAPSETEDAPAPAAVVAGPPAAQGATGEGIFVAHTADGAGATGAIVVIGTGVDAWPFANGFEDGQVAFEPVAGTTYRVSFNVTSTGAGGWRVRWNRGMDIFGMFTAGDYTIVNDHSIAPGTIASVVPAHFNQGVSPDGTYTLQVDVTLDGGQAYNELIGNIVLTGTAGSHDFIVNWVSVERLSGGIGSAPAQTLTLWN